MPTAVLEVPAVPLLLLVWQKNASEPEMLNDEIQYLGSQVDVTATAVLQAGSAECA